MTKPIVAICMPIGEYVEGITQRCLEATKEFWTGRNALRTFDVLGMPIPDARKMLTNEALMLPEVTHLAWIDSDMVWSPNDIDRLLAHNLPIVGGLCFSRRPPHTPVLGRKFHPGWGFAPNQLGWLYDYPRDQLVEVDATGAAFLLVEARVFREISEKLAPLPPDAWWYPQPSGKAEDLEFCRRARNAGFRIFVDTAVKIGHIGKVIIDEGMVDGIRSRSHRPGEWLPNELSFVESHKLTGLSGGEFEEVLGDPSEGRSLRHSMPPAEPIASIVIPTFNQSPLFLQVAVESARLQTAPVEVIVVDDGSIEGLPYNTGTPLPQGVDPAQGTRLHDSVRIIRQPNGGVAAALNAGIREMKTSVFLWLSSDDTFYPNKVEHQIGVMRHAGAGASFTGYAMVVEGQLTGQIAAVPQWSNLADQMRNLARVCAINGSTVMIDRSVLDAVRLPNGDWFDTSYRYAQDWEFWCRVGEKHLWCGIPDTLGHRRDGGHNLSARLREDQAKWTRAREEDARVRAAYSRWLEACPCCGGSRP